MPSAPELVPRLTNYFTRQIAWLQNVLSEFDHFEHALNEPELEALAERQRTREHQLEQFAREQRGLLHEWQQTTDLPETDRQAVKALAAQAKQLTDQLTLTYESAMKTVEQMKTRRTHSVQTLQRGRGMLDKYRPGGDLDPGFIDRKA